MWRTKMILKTTELSIQLLSKVTHLSIWVVNLMESGIRGAEVTRLRAESLWSPYEKLLLSLRAQESTVSAGMRLD